MLVPLKMEFAVRWVGASPRGHFAIEALALLAIAVAGTRRPTSQRNSLFYDEISRLLPFRKIVPSLAQ